MRTNWQRNKLCSVKHDLMAQHRPLGIVVKDNVMGTGCLGFDFRAGQIGRVVATAAVSSERRRPSAQCGDGLRP